MRVRMTAVRDSEEAVRSAFAAAGIDGFTIEVKRYPEETIFIVSVPPALLEAAAEIGNALDGVLAEQGIDGFVTVRRGAVEDADAAAGRVQGVHDDRATELVRQL